MVYGEEGGWSAMSKTVGVPVGIAAEMMMRGQFVTLCLGMICCTFQMMIFGGYNLLFQLLVSLFASLIASLIASLFASFFASKSHSLYYR